MTDWLMSLVEELVTSQYRDQILSIIVHTEFRSLWFQDLFL